MKRILSTVAIAGAVLSIGAGAARASDADATVHHRQQVMNAVGAMMGSLSCVAKKECQLDDKVVARTAKSIAFLADLSVPAFKAKADGATIKHTSKPEIWSDWAKFEAGLKAMGTEASKMAKLAAEGKMADATAQLPAVGKTCKGCHDDFRTK